MHTARFAAWFRLIPICGVRPRHHRSLGATAIDLVLSRLEDPDLGWEVASILEKWLD